MKPDFFTNKMNPINILNILKSQKESDDSDIKYKLLEIDGRKRTTIHKNETSGRDNNTPSESDDIEAITYPEVKRGKSSPKQLNKKLIKIDEAGKE